MFPLYTVATDLIWTDKDMSTYGGYGEIEINHNSSRFGTFVTAEIGNAWSDQEANVDTSVAKANYSQKPDIKEKTIKTVVGDKIGTELFNYIKLHANKIQHDDVWNPYDMGDGIQAGTLDLSAWKNRITDYGKRFSVVYDGELIIHVHNN